MVIESLISNKRNLFWTIFHILLGFVCTITPFALIGWFYFILLSNIQKSITNLRLGKPFLYIALFSYLTAFEMLGRMAKSFPFIPLELSKYFLILFGIIGLMINQKFKFKYFFLIIIISISLLYDYSNQRIFSDIINNYFGILALSLSITFISGLYNLKIGNLETLTFLKLILFAILPSLFFTFLKTPDFDDIVFSLSANFETSGGAATNQVATVFGLGLVICFFSWYHKINFTGNRLFDFAIGLSFLIQGLLTFSRGGIIVGLFSIMLILILNVKINIKTVFFSTLLILLLFVTFIEVDKITGGKLFLRYQGETEGTYNFGAEKNLVKITSGRSSLFEEDLKIWFENPLFGSGIGSSRYIRSQNGEVIFASHIELSRLLAEQGIFGFVFFLVLINIGVKLFRIAIKDSQKSIYFILFFIGFSTTFHSAMRTFVTPLIMGLSVIGIVNVNNLNANIIRRSN